MIKKTPFLTILVGILALAIGPVSAQSVRESDQVGDPQQAKDAVSTAERGSGQYVPAIGASRTATYKSRYRNLINLSLIDTDIRDALSALAMDQEINIATATEVSGKISIHLYQVDLEKALHAITMAGGFSYHKHGDVYYVYKPKKATDPEIDRLEMRIFQLKYADIDKVQEVLGDLPDRKSVV